MTPFLSQNHENNRLELVVDTALFSHEIAMKAAYLFLDRAYFFFRTGEKGLLVQITPKTGSQWSSEKFALEYADELLSTLLRFQIEKENKTIRETIVRRALGSYADLPNFTSVDTSKNSSQIDFDKDIDQILKEIENDPELKIDEEEINRILAEIEAETQGMAQEKKVTLDLNKIKDAKKSFQDKR